RVAVLAPNWPGWREHDRTQSFAIHRWPSTVAWPTSELARRVDSLIKEHRADVVLFGHGFPLALLGPRLARNGVPYVAFTHGAEVWMARMPALAAGIRRALAHAGVVTAVSHYTAKTIRTVVPSSVPLSVLYPGVDVNRFNPHVDGTTVRERYGLQDRPVVLCLSRLVPRKGQDVLIRGLSLLRRLVPDAVLLIAGDGPHRGQLEAEASRAPSGSVVFTGEIREEDAPAHYAACDVFAMPCRSRWGGLEVEGFGIVFLEAAATGKAVVAGRSGGAAEAVADEETGLLVEGSEPKAAALAVAHLLRERDIANRMGAAGRSRAGERFAWPVIASQLAQILTEAAR
ncbi:MAG TPA: glycosyltransferase family 4 protein, partial [Actinomycetota bacterium]